MDAEFTRQCALADTARLVADADGDDIVGTELCTPLAFAIGNALRIDVCPMMLALKPSLWMRSAAVACAASVDFAAFRCAST